MEAIHVPATPARAFNKNRPISDLIRAQINHLKHLEEKLSADARQQIPQHAIVSEADAAEYIAAMTQLLRSQASPSATAAPVAPPVPKKAIPIRPAKGLEIAASGKKAKPASKQRTASPTLPRKGKKR